MCQVEQRQLAPEQQEALFISRLPRILVVDDEENVALSLRAGLEAILQCEVTAVNGGEQALRLLARQPFDLLITDYKMPGMDGMALAAHIRLLYPETKIVMITAYGSDELCEQAARASVRRILDKPVALEDIRSAVIEALGAEREM